MNRPFKILFIKACDGPQGIEVPLGILYLSAYLKAQLGDKISIDLVDLRLAKQWSSVLVDTLDRFSPDLIGISLLSGDRPFLNDWPDFLKNHSPHTLITIGGPLATYGYEEILRNHRSVDFAVLGEGEKAFLNLVTAVMKNEKPADSAGIAYLDNDMLICGGQGKTIGDLDELPFPDYSLIDLRPYTNHRHAMNGVLAEKRHTHIISSRGCPYNCIYCHDIFGKKCRTRSPENFVAEIQWLYDEYHVREFHIIDDIFNLDKARMHDILNRIIASGMRIKIAFPNGIRADLLEQEDILLLKKAGCYMITFAIESASPRIQKMIKKNLNIDKAVENIRYASQAGLITRSFFMLGFPGETVEEIKATVSLAVRSPLDLVFFFTVVPFEYTELARLAASQYPHLNTWDNHFWGQIPFYQKATGYPLKRLQILAYVRFFLPFRIFRTLQKLPYKRRVVRSWVDMAIYIIFTPWYEYLERRHQRVPRLPASAVTGGTLHSTG